MVLFCLKGLQLKKFECSIFESNTPPHFILCNFLIRGPPEALSHGPILPKGLQMKKFECSIFESNRSPHFILCNFLITGSPEVLKVLNFQAPLQVGFCVMCGVMMECVDCKGYAFFIKNAHLLNLQKILSRLVKIVYPIM